MSAIYIILGIDLSYYLCGTLRQSRILPLLGEDLQLDSCVLLWKRREICKIEYNQTGRNLSVLSNRNGTNLSQCSRLE